MHVVVAITGASGIAYGVRLLEALDCEKSLILSDDGAKLLKLETDKKPQDLRKLATHYYKNSQMEAPIASGSRGFDAMVICPCTMSTASKIACGISDNLITRAAAVALKERRKLVIVPRETPISAIHLRNLATLAEAGAIVLPAMPAFYGRPQKVGDLVDFIVGRILDVLGIENELYRRWAERSRFSSHKKRMEKIADRLSELK
jgi:4-hydroxy-3-polyprenylbenzoate decarboxylase